MLPFEKETTRKYQCFVCGVAYSNYEEFRQHLVDSHEEGREFIICPGCDAPVRDMRLHYKAKHNGDKMPQGCQTKALIWKDQAGQKLKTRKPQFRNGTFISLKNGGREMPYKSAFECEFYECLESIPEVLKYDVEPLAIDYWFNGKMRKYYPDLSLAMSDGTIEIWELKPSAQTDLAMNKAKWAAANEYCLTRGWSFIVLTEQGLNKLRKKARMMNG